MHMSNQPTQTKKWLRIVLPAIVVIGWLGLAGIGGPYFGKISDVSSTDLTTFLPSSAESTKVNNELTKFRDDKTIPVIVVYTHGDTVLSDSDMTSIQDANAKLAEVDSVQGEISPPIKSDDNKAAFTVVPLVSDVELKDVFPIIKTKLADAKLPVEYALTGPASFAHDLQGAFAGIDGTLLLTALGVVFVILFIVYRSPLLPFIVLFTSVAALATAILVVYYLAKADIVLLNGQVQGILFILVIGATTDYSLLYIARFREELINHRTRWEATKTALKSSFEPILAAGGTVTVGLLCLLFSDLGSNKALGPVGGIGIVLSITAALTLLPALLLGVGRAAFWPRRPKYVAAKNHHDYEKTHPLWTKVGALVRRHPRRIWTLTTALLLVACIGVFQLDADGVAQSDLILGKSEARDAQKILNAHFASGSGSPAYILADSAKQKDVIEVIEADKGVDSVSVTATGIDSGAAPLGKAETELKEKILAKVVSSRNEQLTTLRSQITEQMAGMPMEAIDMAVTAASANIPEAQSIADAAYPFKDAKEKIVNGKVLLQVTLVNAADSLEARTTVTNLREQLKKTDPSAQLGGVSAIQYDTNEASLRDEIIIIPLILVAITIILMLLLRAIVAPLVLLFTTVLSFGATLGISAFLFNHLWHFPGADPSVVIFGFVFLVALGIDYNIFLMTRVREETLKSGVARGTIKGLVVTGGVITSAGVVLAATFAALSVIPILFLAQLAFIVAFGVLLDTILVRSLLVPAITLEIGKRMWWPSKLSR
jgi:putative drug exporter of the RND superfamily